VKAKVADEARDADENGTPEAVEDAQLPEGKKRMITPKENRRQDESTEFERVSFTKEMFDEGYTILAPQMAPIHFELLQPSSRRPATTWSCCPPWTTAPWMRA
jgi:hypothetical protein